MIQLKDASKLNSVRSRLLKTYQRLQPFFQDGHFFEQYPSEKAKIMGSLVNEGFEHK